MPDIDREKRLAQTAIVREQQKADASVAMAEYRAKQKALLERTRKLREERLAREAAAAKKAAAKAARSRQSRSAHV
jgi:hypothetical protein